MSAAWPFGNARMFGYDVIVADPPWLFDLRSAKGEAKSPQAQYACMSTRDIAALPVGHLCSSDAWLFLWATAPMLPEAIDVMRAWGFQYKSRISWIKRTATGKTRFGPGYVVRSRHEDVLIGAMGTPPFTTALHSIFNGLAREHSRKPDEFYPMIERFSPDARRAELFARQSRLGWTTWGLESTKFDGVTG